MKCNVKLYTMEASVLALSFKLILNFLYLIKLCQEIASEGTQPRALHRKLGVSRFEEDELNSWQNPTISM